MDNEEKNPVAKKNYKLGTIIIILIIISTGLFLFAVGYYIFADKLDNKKLTNNDKVVVELDSAESAEFIKLYERVQPNYYNLTNGYADLGHYYHDNDKILTSNMDNKLKMSLSVKLLLSDDYYDVNKYKNMNGDFQIPKNLLEEAYHLLFGNNSKFKFTEVDTECPGILKESLDNELYPLKDGEIYIATQCSNTEVDRLSQKIVKLEKTKDQKELYIYEEVAYLVYMHDENNEKDYYDYYKDKDRKILIGSAKTETYKEISKKNQMNIHKYTFKLEDGNYYFYSVEKVK